MPRRGSRAGCPGLGRPRQRRQPSCSRGRSELPRRPPAPSPPPPSAALSPAPGARHRRLPRAILPRLLLLPFSSPGAFPAITPPLQAAHPAVLCWYIPRGRTLLTLFPPARPVLRELFSTAPPASLRGRSRRRCPRRRRGGWCGGDGGGAAEAALRGEKEGGSAEGSGGAAVRGGRKGGRGGADSAVPSRARRPQPAMAEPAASSSSGASLPLIESGNTAGPG